MITPEEFCKERGFNGKGSDMTENCLMWAMMRQYAEYYSKYLASDGVSADVSDSFLEVVKQKLFNDWSESLISEEYDEDIPEHYWLQDMTIGDMMELLKSCR